MISSLPGTVQSSEFICLECSKTFTSKINLKNHKLTIMIRNSPLFVLFLAVINTIQSKLDLTST